MYEKLLSQFGSYASLIGLILTLYVAWSLRNIRNNYIFRLKAPAFLRKLTKHASTLISFGNEFETSRQRIDLELAVSDVTLRSMQRRMRGHSKKAVKQLRRLIKDYKQNGGDLEQFYAIYREMQRVLEEVKELQKELTLE